VSAFLLSRWDEPEGKAGPRRIMGAAGGQNSRSDITPDCLGSIKK